MSKVMWQSGLIVCIILVFVCDNIYNVKRIVLKFHGYHSDIKECMLSSLDIFHNLGHYIWRESVYAKLVNVYH